MSISTDPGSANEAGAATPDGAAKYPWWKAFTVLRPFHGGGVELLSYHPRNSMTWHWSVSLIKSQPYLRGFLSLDTRRTVQWHDYLRLPFGWSLCFSHQDLHLQPPMQQTSTSSPG